MRYLSDQWILQADQLVQSLSPVSQPLAIQFDTTGGPDGDKTHVLLLGPDNVAVKAEHAEPNVTFSLGWEDAIAIAKGERSVQELLLNGTIVLTGDATALLGHQPVLQQIQDVLAPLRERTSYA